MGMSVINDFKLCVTLKGFPDSLTLPQVPCALIIFDPFPYYRRYVLITKVLPERFVYHLIHLGLRGMKMRNVSPVCTDSENAMFFFFKGDAE